MKGKIGAVIIAVVLLLALICCVSCLEKVPAGYVGVGYNMNGGVDGEVLTQSWRMVAPTKKVTTYSIVLEQSYLTSEKRVIHRTMRVSVFLHQTVKLLR